MMKAVANKYFYNFTKDDSAVHYYVIRIYERDNHRGNAALTIDDGTSEDTISVIKPDEERCQKYIDWLVQMSISRKETPAE